LLHALLSLFLMLLSFLGAFTTTILAVAYGSWPIYSIPFIGVSIIGWVSMRNRSNEVELDEKDYQNSSKAFDWLVTKFKEDDRE